MGVRDLFKEADGGEDYPNMQTGGQRDGLL